MRVISKVMDTEEVRAILCGRKTQFRQVLRPQPRHLQHYTWNGKVLYDGENRRFCWKGYVGLDPWDNATTQLAEFLPIREGDYLWVKETFHIVPCFHCRGDFPDMPCYADDREERVVYKATEGLYIAKGDDPKWTDPMKMRRWMSRLTLKVDSVEVQPLWDIFETTDDVLAEGFRIPMQERGELHHPSRWVHDYFKSRWNRKHRRKDETWIANPWVMKVDFTTIHMNVDDMLKSMTSKELAGEVGEPVAV